MDTDVPVEGCIDADDLPELQEGESPDHPIHLGFDPPTGSEVQG